MTSDRTAEPARAPVTSLPARGEDRPDAVPVTGDAALPRWRRAVIKVGSNLIAPDGEPPSPRFIGAIARFIGARLDAGAEIVLVSSGAVACGRMLVAGTERQPTLGARQALAALGQPRMFELWRGLIDRPVAQVLLSRDDLLDRRRFVNAKNTLRELLALGALPIVNENDSIAVDELKLGDNDNLAAHVAVLIEADLLVILTDIDGLFDRDPRGSPDALRVARVYAIDADIVASAGGAGSAIGIGGMRTKIEAADKASARGIATVIANGRREAALDALAAGRVDGTLFDAATRPLSARAHWLKHALAPRGAVIVDAGAARALAERGASLLPAGIVRVDGRFSAGDAIDVMVDGAPSSAPLARGLSQLDAGDLARVAGHPTHALDALLGWPAPATAIHRDDLVLL